MLLDDMNLRKFIELEVIKNRRVPNPHGNTVLGNSLAEQRSPKLMKIILERARGKITSAKVD